MDMLSMLINARIMDVDGDEIGEVIGIHIAIGKLWIMVDIEGIEVEDGEDPDGGEKEDIPEGDASKPEFPKIVAMKDKKKDGTNG